MKVCPYCGKENKDSAKFCTGCGKSIEEITAIPGEPAPEPVPAAAPIYKPAPAPAAPAAQPRTPVIARSPAQAKFKELAGSKLALILCIAFTVIVLCSIYTSVFVPASVNNYLKQGVAALKDADLAGYFGDNVDIDEKDIDDALDEFAAALETTVVNPGNVVSRIVSAVSGSAVSVLFAISLWIIFGVAKKEDSVCCGTTGLKIIRVLRTIGLILAILLAVVIALGIAFLIYLCLREGYAEADVLYVLAGCTAVVIILVLFFLGGCVSTAKKYISVSENIPGRSRISGYVGFILFIGAIFSAIGAISWIVASIAGSADLIVYGASAAATAVYQFCLSRFIHRSRKALKGI